MESQKTQEAYKTLFETISEMESYVGKELGLTDWYTMDQERINTFATATEDLQWIHIDKERCKKESPYKQTIAHGFLILSMSSKIMFDSYELKNVSMAINYGLDKVRFPNATPAGSRFRGRVVLAELSKIPKGAKYKLNIVIELEGQEKPACVAEFLALAYT
jgi:acyl dehydratase